ncbi:unnamed protein product [Bursaphelenchus xylophilus]|uniref:(pine wood nematode) hypothetical protein n=1 Tax=Bursaphelenchus xylophilus TaxID=6326 RepID=A0A1I7S8S1_BURXY|nr:unnamed protein product [Bursaphelenchus xylophilus]CAG9085779.1 unnamed protein product [Bursaphelenchus xylophilus]
MSERRRQSSNRYSPYPSGGSYSRTPNRRGNESEEIIEQDTKQPLEEAVVIDDYEQNREAIVEEEAISFRDIGQHAKDQGFTSNAEIINATPIITMDVPAIDVMELFNSVQNGEDMKNTLAGIGLMINRLIFENRYLVRELHCLKSGNVLNPAHRFDSLLFKKVNVINQWIYPGTSEIPPINVNSLVDSFDQNSTRKNDTAVNTLRRFVKYLLENIIPKKHHNKFTIRERGGYDHLTELPVDLTTLVRDLCLETVNLYDPRTDEDKERREELGELIYKYMKFALQELRRTPRKSKVPVARPTEEEIVEIEEQVVA